LRTRRSHTNRHPHPSPLMKKRGFTLIEILLVVFIMAMLAIVAMTSIIRAQKTFTFLNTYQEIKATLRIPRSYAATSRRVGGDNKIAPAYSAKIFQDQIILFADMENPDGTPLEYDEPDLNGDEIDYLLAPIYLLNSGESQRYALEGLDNYPLSTEEDDDQYITLNYEPNAIKFQATYHRDFGEVSKAVEDPYIVLRLTDQQDPNMKRYLVIFTKTGLVEGFTRVSDLENIGINTLAWE
jgi:prepilin-type N-terminal cleavage/methylation domain-containing protein